MMRKDGLLICLVAEGHGAHADIGNDNATAAETIFLHDFFSLGVECKLLQL